MSTYHKKFLKLSIDDESVEIYIERGEDKDPISIFYWHIEENEGDVVISIAKTIDMYHTNPKRLVEMSTANVTLIG